MQGTNPFWQFSQQAWAQPAFAGLCLQLQEEQGCDVNMLLWLAWVSLRGYRLQLAELQQLTERVEPWRAQVILPLRRVRVAVSGDSRQALLRKQLLAAELEAERTQQALMYAAVVVKQAPSDAEYCAVNVQTYCSYAQLAPATEELLRTLLTDLQEVVGMGSVSE